MFLLLPPSLSLKRQIKVSSGKDIKKKELHQFRGNFRWGPEHCKHGQSSEPVRGRAVDWCSTGNSGKNCYHWECTWSWVMWQDETRRGTWRRWLCQGLSGDYSAGRSLALRVTLSVCPEQTSADVANPRYCLSGYSQWFHRVLSACDSGHLTATLWPCIWSCVQWKFSTCISTLIWNVKIKWKW